MSLRLKLLCIPLFMIFGTNLLFANEQIADQYPGSDLYSSPYEVIPNVFSAIGATAPPTL